MGRRTRRRWVSHPPKNLYFSDENPTAEDCVILDIPEFEAMRLKHYLNFNQKEAALKMGVSQPTFSRIIENAHQKTTQALYEGKKIMIYGGNIHYKSGFIGYGCLDCNNEWEDKTASKEKKVECIKCNSQSVYYLVKEIL